jgi:ribosomal protein S18 acetylase RimI-like enzyme
MKGIISNLDKIITIRKFKIEDYEKVIQLWIHSGLPYRPKGRDRKEKIAIEAEKETALFLIAEIDGVIGGVVFGTHDGRKGWINRLAVHPEFRNRNIAKKLVAEVEKQLLTNGIEIMTCLIEDSNIVSQNVFKKLGFKKWNDISYFSKRMNPDV